MTTLQSQIKTAQRRLWFNRWLGAMAIALAIAGAAFAALVLVQRLWDLPIPLKWIGAAGGFAAFWAATISTYLHRETPAEAAAKLDEAAGLRERISTGQYCVNNADPFAQAVVADAERVGTALSVRSHIRLHPPQRLGYALCTLIAAACMFLITPGWLKPTEAKEASKLEVEREQTHVAVKKQMEAVRQITESSPVLEDLAEKTADLDKPAGGQLQRPGDIRHEAIKKIDRLEDAVKEKLADEKYEALPEMRKMLRGLQTPDSTDPANQKLSDALQKGDFKTAKEEVKKLQEELATLKSDQDKELVDKMSKQLADLAKQMEKLAADDKLKEKLEQLGIKPEDAQRMLERLSKSDLDQLKKQMEEKGMNQQQMEKLAKQLQDKQMSGAMAKKLAGAMKQGSKANQPGQANEAMAGLSEAEQQLSELEQLESEMKQLESAQASLKDAKNQIDKPCPS